MDAEIDGIESEREAENGGRQRIRVQCGASD